jgi:hypothetical protein
MHYLLIIVLLMTAAACDRQPGPDSITSHGGTVSSCSCHNTAIGTRRQVLGPGGDFGANPAMASHHVAGSSDPTFRQCIACHDLSTHMSGTVRLRNADSGAVTAYDPAVPATLEPFCLSCHDANGAAGNMSPFADGATLGTVPYVAGTTIASSWNGSSTHKDRGLTCAGTGQPGTGCHGTISTPTGTINMHGSTIRGLLTNTMNFQIPLVNQAVYSAGRASVSSYDENNYRLCFDCHANYPSVSKEVVLGFRSGGFYDIFEQPTPLSLGTYTQASHFRDYYTIVSPPFYSDTMWGYTYMALHNYHLIGFESRAILVPAGVNALQWKYRGDPASIGRITCTACHNVHGTTVPTIRSTHEALGLTQFVNVADIYVTLGTPSSIANPMNCAVDCHTPGGQTSYWYTPARE